MSATDRQWPEDWVCPQRFLAPLAPPLAAAQEGKIVNFQQLVDGANRFGSADCLLIEGAGGWLSPLTDTRTNADLAVALETPILIVARSGLGTINHTLLTIEAIRSRGLLVAGIVLNTCSSKDGDESVESNPNEIEARSGAPVLGSVSFGNCNELHRDGKPVTINWRRLSSS
jgi:dethiobiotin synthetase